MITITENVNIAGGTAPFNYVVSSTCSNVNIVDPVGTTSESVIPITMEFSSESQLNTCSGTFTITVTDADNCVATLNLVLTNPCENFQLVGGISELDFLRFTVNPTGGVSPYT